MTDEMLTAVDEIFANANRVVAGVRDDQWDAQTPCSEWSVRQLVEHMTGTANMCVAAATRSDPADAGSTDDPVATFSTASAVALGAWRSEGALDGMVSVPFEMPAVAALGLNILDIGTHTWDLATATSQSHGLSPELIEMIDTWNHELVSDEARAGGGFGGALDPASDDRLTQMLAFVGRQG